MGENRNTKATALAKLAAAIVLAGGLVAGLALPYVGGAGLAARDSADLVNGLPEELTIHTPTGATRVLAADGSLITEFYEHNRTPVTSDKIAPAMKQAQVDIEDSRFYEHNGLDIQGTFRALVTNLAAGSVQEGGSTLTQQLVKQTLLQTANTPAERQAAVQQTLGRKLREAKLAMGVDKKYSKDEILTRYLNTVYFGEGAYGVEAAAETYFSAHASDLSLPQAALLAGLVQSPSGDDPVHHLQNATTRRNEVLKRMRDLGHITDQQYKDAVGTPVQLQQGQAPPNGCQNAVIGGFFCDFVQSYLVNTLKIPQSELDNGGLTIQTTLRPDLQRSADQSVLNTVPMGSPVVGTFTAVEPGTGHVLAMANNRQFGCPASQGPQCESVNFNVVPTKGSGSTYKLFTATTALEQGFGANYTIDTPQPYTSKVYTTWDSTLRRAVPYTVSNVGTHYPDILPMSEALVRSSNTYFVGLEDALGSIAPIVHTAQTLGMRFDAPNQGGPADKIIKENRGSFTLGTGATSPLDLATAYATIAGRGTRCTPVPVTKVLDQNGQPLTDANGKPYDTGDRCTPNVVPQNIADTLNQIMIGDTAAPYGTAGRAAIPGHDIAGKTGTDNEQDSVSFVGSTPNYTASVMVFRAKGTDSVGGYGGNMPAQIWHDTMLPILAPTPNVPWPPADPAVFAGDGQHQGYVPPAPANNPAPATNGDTAPPAVHTVPAPAPAPAPAPQPAPQPAPVPPPAAPQPGQPAPGGGAPPRP